jgi:nucleoside-diphosphate-sugar epimerase
MGEHAMSIAPGDVMHVAVIGATGALGRHVVPRLLERGHHVRTLVRRVEQGERLRRTGASPVLGDIFNPESLLEVTRNCQAVLHLATAIPADGSDWTLNDRIRREGTRNVIGAALQNRVGRYVQQSITFLYGEQSEPVADETTPLRPDRVTQSAADMEALVRAAGLDWCILRGGLVLWARHQTRGALVAARPFWRAAHPRRRQRSHLTGARGGYGSRRGSGGRASAGTQHLQCGRRRACRLPDPVWLHRCVRRRA